MIVGKKRPSKDIIFPYMVSHFPLFFNPMVQPAKPQLGKEIGFLPITSIDPIGFVPFLSFPNRPLAGLNFALQL